MLGRLAYHDPYSLARIDAALHGGETPARETVLRSMRPYIEAECERGVRLGSITRHLLGLYHAEPGGKAFRRVLSERARAEDAGWDAVEAALAQVDRRAMQAVA
jgi:tRNA-dihydrouridine synthase A